MKKDQKINAHENSSSEWHVCRFNLTDLTTHGDTNHLCKWANKSNMQLDKAQHSINTHLQS